MEDSTWIATIAGLALGIGIILAFVLFKNNNQSNDAAVKYTYDDQNRLESVIPIKRVNLKAVD